MSQPLFELGKFISHAGNELEWKIECDALSAADWECLAKMISERVQPFGSVYGIPRGGVPLATCLEKYVTEGPRLVVDDVWTTGKSMRDVMKDGDIGYVVFARNLVTSPVKALFTMDV